MRCASVFIHDIHDLLVKKACGLSQSLVNPNWIKIPIFLVYDISCHILNAYMPTDSILPTSCLWVTGHCCPTCEKTRPDSPLFVTMGASHKSLIAKESQAMAHHGTVLSQLLRSVPRHKFDILAKQQPAARWNSNACFPKTTSKRDCGSSIQSFTSGSK